MFVYNLYIYICKFVKPCKFIFVYNLYIMDLYIPYMTESLLCMPETNTIL